MTKVKVIPRSNFKCFDSVGNQEVGLRLKVFLHVYFWGGAGGYTTEVEWSDKGVVRLIVQAVHALLYTATLKRATLTVWLSSRMVHVNIHWREDVLVYDPAVCPRQLVARVDGAGLPVRPVEDVVEQGESKGVRKGAFYDHTAV